MPEDALLAQVRVLAEKHEGLAASSGQNFNLFTILRWETDEVRPHSPILAELLDPNGSDRQGPGLRGCLPTGWTSTGRDSSPRAFGAK